MTGGVCATCDAPLNGNYYEYRAAQKLKQVQVCPACWELKLTRETREEFAETKKRNYHAEQRAYNSRQ